MKIKVNYDSNSGEVKGYYPDNIKYDTNIPEPYVVILEANRDSSGAVMVVEEGIYKRKGVSESDLKITKSLSIKSEAFKRIIAAYPEWRQRNHMAAIIDIQNKELVALKSNTTYTPSADEIATITAAQTAKNQVFAIRAKSDQLEASLDSMTLAELEAFDPTNDSNWI